MYNRWCSFLERAGAPAAASLKTSATSWRRCRRLLRPSPEVCLRATGCRLDEEILGEGKLPSRGIQGCTRSNEFGASDSCDCAMARALPLLVGALMALVQGYCSSRIMYIRCFSQVLHGLAIHNPQFPFYSSSPGASVDITKGLERYFGSGGAASAGKPIGAGAPSA